MRDRSSKNLFKNRVDICKDFRGLRVDELKKVTGLDDAEFVHSSGFIGGAWSLKSAIKIAEMSLLEYKKS